MMEIIHEVTTPFSNSNKENGQQSISREEDSDIIDETLIYSFKQLIKKYRKQMGDNTSDLCVASGGLQQYLNRKKVPKSTQNQHAVDDSFFNALPVNVKLKIFGYLDAKDLCRITRVCKSWSELCEDNLLWQHMLQRDVKTWHKIGHTTNPALYREVQSEWSNKQIYLQCSPEIKQLMHQENTVFNSLASMLRYLLPRKARKIAMFGPGLESDTSGLVRKMLYEDNDKMKRTGMAPGQFGGVGSGWFMQMQDGNLFQLSVLYSASKKVRQDRARYRLKGNGLLEMTQNAEGQQTIQVKPAVRDFLRTVDAFVYVVDASQTAESVAENRDELVAMVSEQWFATNVPVLVMSCVPDGASSRVPCIDIVNALKMSEFNRPWQVHDCVVDDLSGVIDSIQWLMAQYSHGR